MDFNRIPVVPVLAGSLAKFVVDARTDDALVELDGDVWN